VDYLVWNGLSNPKSRVQTYCRRELHEKRSLEGKFRRRILIFFYRRWRAAARFTSAAASELTASKKRTLAELALGSPAVLIAFDPVRNWVDQHPMLWFGVASSVVLSFCISLLGGFARRRDTQAAYREHAASLQLLYELLAVRAEAANRPSPAALRNAVTVALGAIRDIAIAVVQVPDNTHVFINLMIRMPVQVKDNGQQDGCGIVCYGPQSPPKPAWTVLPAGDWGAAECFGSGQVYQVSDTHDPFWCGVYDGGRTRSFASFPVQTFDREVIAVVNIDADRPDVFTLEATGNDLYPVLSGPLGILADILMATHSVKTV
jgi:hypothetical protein